MKKAANDTLIVELDGSLIEIAGSTARRLSRIPTTGGNKWVLSDFQNAVFGLRTVEAPPRYAELVLQRRLQESGDVEGSAHVFSHWKLKRGRTSTDLLYTAVSDGVHSAYLDRAHTDPGHHLLFAFGSLLKGVLDSHSRRRTVAVLFEHDRHVDYLVGRAGRVFGAGRVSTYSNAPEAKAGLEDSLGSELKAIENNEGTKVELIVYVSWLFNPTGETPWLRPLAERLNARAKNLKPRQLRLGAEEVLETSLPGAFDCLSHAGTVSEPGARIAYTLERLAPRAVAAAALVAVLTLGTGTWFTNQASELRAEAKYLEQSTGLAELQQPGALPDYQKTVELADRLDRLQTTPSLQSILADLTAAREGKITLEQISVGYDENDAAIELKGNVSDSFPKAKHDHLAFLANLRAKGYRVTESDYSTDVQRLDFSLQLKRGLM